MCCTKGQDKDESYPGMNWKVLIRFEFYLFLAAPQGLWDLSFWSEIKPAPPAVEMQGPNHWTATEVPGF